MAEIRPFRALRYGLEMAGKIDTLVCPPYDIISGPQREALLEKNPFNMVRLELPVGSDPYGEAARTLKSWLKTGVLKQDMDEGVYLYEEGFTYKGETKKLFGMICLVRLEEFASGVVLPHEETLSKAKEDRFLLTSATGCNFSAIYCLYHDGNHITRRRLENLMRTCAPRYDFSDGESSHRLWVINDTVAISALREDFSPRKLYIADGHHRYETALRYRDSLREQCVFCPEADYVMMFLTDMENPGLAVFPTHRLVKGLERFDEAALLSGCEKWFQVEGAQSREETEALLDEHYEKGLHAFGFFAGGEWSILTLRDESVMEKFLPKRSPACRALDVSVLHTLVLENLLSIGKDSMAAQKNLTYTRSAEEAEASVRAGESQCCFLLNPTRVEEIAAVAAAGEKMPQKSTYFYPKLTTGLVMNPIRQEVLYETV